ncbi:AAA family ATPase [Pseudovibrio exalbescens]|uniref:AAA family ATPase n=1 Tax=Pseudovibrio exalbescens TaxID=197461 RepID=UPI00236697EA|nr:AAA family ATPase [Pseudovibrio exalbescens]MDD7911965.1 AAA family ATPase [Pseudovibrio exalbescens]
MAVSASEHGLMLSQMKADHKALSSTLAALAQSQFPPKAQKILRKFPASEAASYLGITPRYLALSADEMGLEIAKIGRGERRFYSLEQMNQIRRYLAEKAGDDAAKALNYDPRRREGDDLQIFACSNFKGGSAKTCTSVHLAQYLALQGYRILLVDLDPQGSASSMLGVVPELVAEDESLYAAIRYQDPRPLREVVQKTYFDNLDLAVGSPFLTEWEFFAPHYATLAGQEEPGIRNRIADIEDERKQKGISNARLRELEDELARENAALSDCLQRKLYFTRLQLAFENVEPDYDVIICDTPPSLGYLSNAASFAADHLLVTIHPQWIDCESMAQYLATSIAHNEFFEETVAKQLGPEYLAPKSLQYLITRHDNTSRPETDVVTMLRSQLQNVLTNTMLRSSAIAEAGNVQQTLYEADRTNFNGKTYDRALDSVNKVNGEIEDLLKAYWGRS